MREAREKRSAHSLIAKREADVMYPHVTYLNKRRCTTLGSFKKVTWEYTLEIEDKSTSTDVRRRAGR